MIYLLSVKNQTFYNWAIILSISPVRRADTISQEFNVKVSSRLPNGSVKCQVSTMECYDLEAADDGKDVYIANQLFDDSPGTDLG